MTYLAVQADKPNMLVPLMGLAKFPSHSIECGRQHKILVNACLEGFPGLQQLGRHSTTVSKLGSKKKGIE